MPSSSSTATMHAPSTSHAKLKKRKWTREQLLQAAKTLDDIFALPLPPSSLPLSPPTSRSTSPAPGSKRKAAEPSQSEHPKKPRTTAAAAEQRPHSHSSTPAHASGSRPPRHTEAASDGGSASDPAVKSVDSARAGSSRTVHPLSTTGGVEPPGSVPMRRPRRGGGHPPTSSVLEEISKKHHEEGRVLKFSGEARFFSTYPPTHPEYKKLNEPPPPSSSYHRNAGLISRLELTEAFMRFSYSSWAKDYAKKVCFADNWMTQLGVINVLERRWGKESSSERDAAFHGLVLMLQAFIFGRITTYAATSVVNDRTEQLNSKTKVAVARAIEGVTRAHGAASRTAATMLPSPASLGGTSANSTPTGRSDETPNSAGRGGESPAPGPPQPRPAPGTPAYVPSAMLPHEGGQPLKFSREQMAAAAAVTVPVDPGFVHQIHFQQEWLQTARTRVAEAEKKLNLPVLARHFPHTFQRLVYSTLTPNEEYEPELEDNDGELCWPGQLTTGEGIAWVCHMGMSMIREAGKEVGYVGLEAVVTKESQAVRSDAP